MRRDLDNVGQVSTEYLIILAIAVLLSVMASAGLIHIENLVGDEYNKIKNAQEQVISVLLS